MFSNRHVPIAQCRSCLFKALCLENEKNPVIRYLVLGEDIRDDVTDVFDGTDTIQEIEDLLAAEPNNIHFVVHPKSDIVDVLYNESLLYKINKSLYNRLVDENRNFGDVIDGSKL